MYQPKYVFVSGLLVIGVFSIVAGFLQNIIGLIIMRALEGLGASMTVPSATLMLTQAYPQPLEQGIALTVYASIRQSCRPLLTDQFVGSPLLERWESVSLLSRVARSFSSLRGDGCSGSSL